MTLSLRIASVIIIILTSSAACTTGGTAPGSAGGSCRQLGDAPCEPGLECIGGVCTGPGGGNGDGDGDVNGDGDGPDGGDNVTPLPGAPDAGIIVIPDAQQPPTGPCDPVRQTGCPGGQRCTLIGDGIVDTPTCEPDDGYLSLGQACTFTPHQADACLGAGQCVGDTCRRHCDATSGCSELCVPFNNGYSFCLPSCNVLTQGCGAGAACYPVGNDYQACLPAGNVPIGNTCYYANDCASGAGCDTSYGCRRYCDAATYPGVQDPFRCSANETCAAYPDVPGIGLCLPTF